MQGLEPLINSVKLGKHFENWLERSRLASKSEKTKENPVKLGKTQ